jgi:hypothetical protein
MACTTGMYAAYIPVSRCIFDKFWIYSDQRQTGVKLLGLLLAGSTGQHMASRNGLTMGWPDIHWLERDQCELAGFLGTPCHVEG